METDICKTLLYKRSSLYILNAANEDMILNQCANFLNKSADIIEYRPILNDDRLSIVIGHKIRQLCSIYNAILFVKSRCDIANIINANGVTLELNDISINDSRKVINHDMITGTYYFNDSSDFMLANNIQNIHKNLFIKQNEYLYVRK